MATETKTNLCGCWGCGDLTTGAKSLSTGTLYPCCPCCCERSDQEMDRRTPKWREEAGDNLDRGPYEEAGVFPACPKCGCEETIPAGTEMYCGLCDYEWTPAGVYDGVKLVDG